MGNKVRIGIAKAGGAGINERLGGHLALVDNRLELNAYAERRGGGLGGIDYQPAREAALEFCELNSRRIRRRGWCHWRRRRRYGGWFYLCARTTREGRDVHIVV